MKRNEILSYTYDFVHFLTDNLKCEIKEIILFGSVARGDFRKNSDVDLFINIKNKRDTKKIEKIVQKAVNEFETSALHSWRLRKIDLPLKPIVGVLDSKEWSALKREIISTGHTLYGKYKDVPKGLNQQLLFSFSLKSLEPRKKVKFIRQLYGYQTKKEKKTYTHKGILENENAVKINPSTILVPAESCREIYGLFKQFRIKHAVREIWM